jgi:hypothetical protein
MDKQTQVLENLQDIKELAYKIIHGNHYDFDELIKYSNEIQIKAHNSIELIYNTKNTQLIKPKYEFSLPKA